MGEKPMGLGDAAEDVGAGLQLGGVEVALGGEGEAPDEDDDPMARAGSINTTRSNIKNSAGVASTADPPGTAGGAPDDPPAAAGDPVPDIDVR